jgi:hypothetical protein
MNACVNTQSTDVRQGRLLDEPGTVVKLTLPRHRRSTANLTKRGNDVTGTRVLLGDRDCKGYSLGVPLRARHAACRCGGRGPDLVVSCLPLIDSIDSKTQRTDFVKGKKRFRLSLSSSSIAHRRLLRERSNTKPTNVHDYFTYLPPGCCNDSHGARSQNTSGAMIDVHRAAGCSGLVEEGHRLK